MRNYLSNLHVCTFNKRSAIANRLCFLLHFIALLALLHYRISSLLLLSERHAVLLLTHLLVFFSELLLSLIWLCDQAYRWRPVTRKNFPERLPDEKELPGVDVFICTADPKKEPPVEVMNTVLSAMALDYPPEKLSVYVSDDAGSSVTLGAVREAWVFAKSWLLFCRRFGVKSRCPKVYFSGLEDDSCGIFDGEGLRDYEKEREKIKRKYEHFKDCVSKVAENAAREEAKKAESGNDHAPVIEVIHEESGNDDSGIKQAEMPLVVYISREKRPSHPHHFKAGALNVLLRVSGIMTNSPYILVLDCDMYCNESSSARQAMCFHLDPKISKSLAFVQFPQKFHTISKSDIYDGQLSTIFAVRWPGMDGLSGPMLSGTGFYMKRGALYGNILQKDPLQLKQSLGHSNEFIMSFNPSNQHNAIAKRDMSSKEQKEAQFLASCAYEKHTLWGEQIGFLYFSVVEDYFTGFILHCKGWNSVLCNPSVPAFMGCAPTNLNDTLVQSTRWNSGLLEVTLSRFCPLTYGLSRMSLLQTMCYGYFSLQPLYSMPVWCLAVLPQLCLLSDIPIYPKVSSLWFGVFSFIFLISLLRHFKEVLATGGSFQTWLNQQQVWMIKSVTGYTYGSLHAILKCFGVGKANFTPTNKVANDEEMAIFQLDKLNFQASIMYLAPIVTLVILNTVAFTGGVARMLIAGNWEELFGQVCLSLYILVVNYPVIEGMLLRKDKGRIPFSASLLSLAITVTVLGVGYIFSLC